MMEDMSERGEVVTVKTHTPSVHFGSHVTIKYSICASHDLIWTSHDCIT